MPGEISDTSITSEYENSKASTYHLTQLDIFQDKTEHLSTVEFILENKVEEDSDVQTFELDQNHNYNAYVHKSRFDF